MALADEKLFAAIAAKVAMRDNIIPVVAVVKAQNSATFTLAHDDDPPALVIKLTFFGDKREYTTEWHWDSSENEASIVYHVHHTSQWQFIGRGCIDTQQTVMQATLHRQLQIAHASQNTNTEC